MKTRVLLILTFVAIALRQPSATSAEEWPRWRGPRGDGTWNGPKLAEKWPAEGLPVRWRQPIGAGYAGVTVADGRVFVMDRVGGDPPAEGGTPAAESSASPKPAEANAPAKIPEVERVTAFGAATGERLWRHEYPVHYGQLSYGSGPRAAPTLSAGRVYTLGAMGHLYCLDAASGEVVWSHDCAAEYGARIPEWGFAASPLIWENLVIVHAGARPHGCYQAFDRRTGAEVWRASADPVGYATPLLIDRTGGPQLVGWTPEHVLGIDPRGGEIQWSIPYKVTYGVAIATPIFQQGIVFVSGYWEGSKAIQLGDELSDAKLAWEDNESLRGLMSQPLYRDGYSYLLDKRFGLTCFEWGSGRKVWDDGNRVTPRDRNPQASLIWLGHSAKSLALNAEGELVYAQLTPQGYREYARAKIVGPTWAHPAYAGSDVFARDDSQLVCVPLPVDGATSVRP